MGAVWQLEKTYKATDYYELPKVEQCPRCMLGVQDGKVIHKATCDSPEVDNATF